MASTVRFPRSVVKIGGVAMAGLKSWTWDGNTMFQADTFSCEFAIGALSAQNGLAWLDGQTDLEVEILCGFPADPANADAPQLESLFVGRVDEVSVDWAPQTLRLSGRDRTADLLDNKTSEKYPNQTASQIAEKLAGAHGLTPVVTATKTKVGRYYQTDNVRLQDDRTEWDLLTWLAREEGYVVYVKGRELHFEPKPKGSATYPVKYIPGSKGQTPSGAFVDLQTVRVLTVARDIVVNVRSWNAKKKRTFVRKAQKSGGGGHPQLYTYTIAGLTPEQAQQRANQILAELSRHERRLTLRGPADNLLGKSDVIGLSGTGTGADQSYFPDVISRSFDVGGGYVWHVQAKNHSPESEPSL